MLISHKDLQWLWHMAQSLFGHRASAGQEKQGHSGEERTKGKEDAISKKRYKRVHCGTRCKSDKRRRRGDGQGGWGSRAWSG